MERRPPVCTDRLWDSPFLRACRRAPVDRTPLWLMRQAGRFLPEYRAIRERVSFLELAKTPDLACEVTEMAVRLLGVDAAIIFADILLVTEALGLRLTFEKGDGPVIHDPVRTSGDLARLREPDVESLAYVYEAIRLTRAALPPDVPLIGFAGAPFTVASYIVEGGGSRHYTRTKALMAGEPETWHALLDRVARLTGAYLARQAAAGAQVVQLFDSWVGCLSPADYRTYVLPHSRAVIEAVPAGVPVIHFGTGNPALLPSLREAGGDVIGLDWRVDLGVAWDGLGEVAVQGNLDPASLLLPREVMEARARAVLEGARGRVGHIFNLGHGVLPPTPVDNVLALVDLVHAHPLGGGGRP